MNDFTAPPYTSLRNVVQPDGILDVLSIAFIPICASSKSPTAVFDGFERVIVFVAAAEPFENDATARAIFN